MSHRVSATGHPFAECDEPIRDAAGIPVTSATGGVTLCQRRTFGAKERFGDVGQLDIFDLPRGWSVVPYPDDFDHGATRISILDGTPIKPLPWLAGIHGDLHTCPGCRR